MSPENDYEIFILMKHKNDTDEKATVSWLNEIGIYSCHFRQTAEFPITYLHVHLKGDFTIEDAEKSEVENIQYGIAVN
ncbi:MAG: hypothetical protein MZV63_42940 [Marinilabiliales bacterium]|nr:hypothetical protein [Marinilabiliales bacterium]